LGVLYHQGIGVEQNVERAFDWYKTAADLGHPEAQYNLGIAHIEGIGVSYDPQRAATYFKAASEGGVMEAAYNLGLIYENGLLGKAEPDTALMWYKRAADQGSPEAKAALEQLANKLGMQISDVNRLIKGMESLNAPAQKKTEKSVKTSSASPVDLAPSQALSTTAQVQQQLMAMGLYPGPVDGIEGALTKDAVRTYQSRNNLAVDGEINESLLSHMQYQFQDIGDNEQGSRAN
jgi:TPR repeat protein